MNAEYDARKPADPLISIIVPVYKVEAYLKKCVDSILAQTYQKYELILVDDGSPDRCGEICDQYARDCAAVRVIHQANQGQAAARNNGVKSSTGELITFIDSDDYVEPDYLEYLLGLLRRYNADIAVGGFCYLYEGDAPKQKSAEEKDERLGACEALMRMNYNRGLGATPWVKLYKRELILRHPFPEKQIYEDLAVLYQIVGDCDSVAIGGRKVYYWVQRKGSTMRMKFDERQMAAMDAVAAQFQYVQTKYPAALDSVKYRYAAKAIELMAVCFHSGGDRTVFQTLRKHMKKYIKDMLRDKKAKPTMKARAIAAVLGYYPAKLVFTMHEKAKRSFS